MISDLRRSDPLVSHATRLLMRVTPDSSRVHGVKDPVALADARTSSADARDLLRLRLAEASARHEVSA